MSKKHVVILVSCLVFGAADYYVTHFPDSAFAEFTRVNNTAIGIAAIIVFTVLFFAGRKKGR
ncbi:MAG: hypothetical protein P4N59_13715 [Negativicutes bacterium]|nr:hypothetical protein [Negativicutes bacterium]